MVETTPEDLIVEWFKNSYGGTIEHILQKQDAATHLESIFTEHIEQYGTFADGSKAILSVHGWITIPDFDPLGALLIAVSRQTYWQPIVVRLRRES